MKFDDLDKKMRVYEQSLDQVVVPGMFMAARIDGRSFTRLTKEICKFEAPFDERFRDMMVNTVKALMDCGFRVLYGYTESDEISLLFDPEENTFGRIIPLPNIELVQDYFLWRQEDANRNALNSWCYWTLRKEGMSVAEATVAVSGKSVAYKNELLFEREINYDKLPSWQKRGTGIWWDTVEKTGYNPVKKREEKAVRRSLYEYNGLCRGYRQLDMVGTHCQ